MQGDQLYLIYENTPTDFSCKLSFVFGVLLSNYSPSGFLYENQSTFVCYFIVLNRKTTSVSLNIGRVVET